MGHRWWHNDPDCLMFGEHTRLTDDEVASAASIVAMTCGMLLLSDDLPKVPAQVRSPPPGHPHRTLAISHPYLYFSACTF
jgi:hypothetical protein